MLESGNDRINERFSVEGFQEEPHTKKNNTDETTNYERSEKKHTSKPIRNGEYGFEHKFHIKDQPKMCELLLCKLHVLSTVNTALYSIESGGPLVMCHAFFALT